MKKLKLLLATVVMSGIMAFTAFAGEWKQDNVGWWYENDDGSYPVSTWQQDAGKWYLFDANGYMRTGWIKTVNDAWYYLNPSGEMRYDALTENGVTYYFNADGSCQNPNAASSDNQNIDFNSDYQSIVNQELLEAQARQLEQQNQSNTYYEETTVYFHDASSEPEKDRFGLADMQF